MDSFSAPYHRTPADRLYYWLRYCLNRAALGKVLGSARENLQLISLYKEGSIFANPDDFRSLVAIIDTINFPLALSLAVFPDGPAKPEKKAGGKKRRPRNVVIEDGDPAEDGDEEAPVEVPKEEPKTPADELKAKEDTLREEFEILRNSFVSTASASPPLPEMGTDKPRQTLHAIYNAQKTSTPIIKNDSILNTEKETPMPETPVEEPKPEPEKQPEPEPEPEPELVYVPEPEPKPEPAASPEPEPVAVPALTVNEPTAEPEDNIDMDIFETILGETLVIDDYTMEDRERTLVQIAQDRHWRSKQRGVYSACGIFVLPTDTPPLVASLSANITRSPVRADSETPGETPPMSDSPAPSSINPRLTELDLNVYPTQEVALQEAKANGTTPTNCYGCGTSFASGKLFRAAQMVYCEYTGQFFCTRCHTGQKYFIPGRITKSFDTQQYPVNNYSYRYLFGVYAEPIINLTEANPDIYRVLPVLKDMRLVRRKLLFMKDFIMTCKRISHSDLAWQKLEIVCSPHHYNSIDEYSISDLVNAFSLLDKLMGTLEVWLTHIGECPACSEKGSYCEICRKDQRIFPFQLLDVVQCKKCKGVFHRACWKKDFCPKCKRIEARLLQAQT